MYQNILAENSSVKYADSEEELYAKLQDIKRENSVSKVLFLGAGDIYNIAKNLVNAFNNKDKNAQKIVYKM